MTKLLIEKPTKVATTLMLAHGAGAPATSAWMNRVCELLVDAHFKVARFDFSYMAQRQSTGARRPPPKAEALVAEYRAAVEALQAAGVRGPLLIGGKSLGGRVASLVAQELYDAKVISGLVCLGYPFHPPAKPDQLRTRHLETLTCPTLIVQGERDPFGTPQEVAGYPLSRAIDVRWLTDGDHDFAPRRASGASLEGNLAAAVAQIAAFADGPGQTR